ncbi:ATP-binding protein [Thalassovita sp.]|uniref:ATP-binding protein n=1 Tax=Thalassovita sp. TaxID=1979401 RepID=UPI0028828A02|nr:ATP-binding protein [Thalassovita sp.]MDF1802657.1 ATP-binding protein [Thalassovita sp.]
MTLPIGFDIRFDATELGVRGALSQLQSFLQRSSVQDDDCGKAEIVVAEALNNVVEHAYAETGNGTIDLRCRQSPLCIDITILDRGVPVPVHVFAKRQPPNIDVEIDDLPEGGFGWMLIQEMTENLSYQRVDGTNCLRMAIPLRRE